MKPAALITSVLLLAMITACTIAINTPTENPFNPQLLSMPSPAEFPDDWSREPLYEAPRSSCWRKTRNEFIEQNPRCAFKGCEGVEIEAHHVLTFKEHPGRECDPTNLISLCRDGANHHLWVGHNGNFKESNPRVRQDCLKGEFPSRGWLRKQAHDAEVERKSRDVFR